jgi:hypothetical protein
VVSIVLFGEKIVRRNEAAVEELLWGELEHLGMIFLSSTPTADQLVVRLPFIFLHKYVQDLPNFPQEPVLRLSPTLDKDENEKQDLATVLHHLWRESVIERRKEVDLAEFIPGLAHGIYVVEPPKKFAVKYLRNRVNNVKDLEALFNSWYKSFDRDGQAFKNAERASWGDTFVFLKLVKQKKWMVLILQSKRRASKEEQRKTQSLTKDLNKVLGKKRTAFVGSMFDYLYLFITDCSVAEQIAYPEHFCVITRNKHKEFYGEYRQKLRDIRDLATYNRLPQTNLNPAELDLTTNGLAKLTVPQLREALSVRGESIKV